MKRIFLTTLSILLLVSAMVSCQRREDEGGINNTPDTQNPVENNTDGENTEEIKYLYSGEVSKGIEYKINPDGTTCTVIGVGNCKDKFLNIGEEIDGFKVTAIGKNFKSNENVLSIKIPDTVVTIEEEAFSLCKSVIGINIGSGVGIPNLHPLKNNGVF